MKYPGNIREVAALQPYYMGFIFYSNSKRYVLKGQEDFSIDDLPESIKKVGVFVNAPIKDVIRLTTQYEMDLVQLHGDEAPEYCEDLKMLDFKIIKAFGVDAAFDFWKLAEYKDHCDYYLFDKKSGDYGGTGEKFDWTLLKQYDNSKPVFLSGGLDKHDITDIHDLLKGLNIHALDFNSKLELEPGLKDVEKCREVIEEIRKYNER
jgi:phosphoribosylanthranilate isomerase